MVLPDKYLSDGNGASTLDLTAVNVSFSNSVVGQIDITALGATTATSYKYRYVLQSGDLSTAVDTTVSSNSFSITGLSPGSYYKIQVRAYASNGTYGTATIKENIFIPPVSSVGSSIKDSSIEKQSFYSIKNNSNTRGIIEIAYKAFTDLPTDSSYYAFGSTILMESLNDASQAGGLGFFVKNQGQTGYFVKIKTTPGVRYLKQENEIEVIKVVNGDLIALTNQEGQNVSKLTGIYSNRAYKIDIKVKIETRKTTIKLYVNGYEITAIDNEAVGETRAGFKNISPSNTVAMYSIKGEVLFDYLYGTKITDDQYNDNKLYGVYNGKYSQLQLNTLFGENTFITQENSITGFTEEFGPIAREIRYFKFKFPEGAAMPIAPTTGANDNVKILVSRLNNFGGEAYLLNNFGYTSALSSETGSSFTVYGYSISKTSEIQYDNFDKNLYTTEDPVAFQTNWLQNENDVVRLSEWLKAQWAKKQLIINMEVFGNPLIQVGDIIKIIYPYQGLTSSQKFIVLSVSHRYQVGISTSISCRSIS